MSLLVFIALGIAGWIGYSAWQDTVIDVAGLQCAISDPATGEKGQFGLLLRKKRSEEAPSSLWTQESNAALPTDSYDVCEATPDHLAFRAAGASCETDFKGSTGAEKKKTFDFTINRKNLQMTIGDSAEIQNCEVATPAQIRAEWQKAYEDRVKGNRF